MGAIASGDVVVMNDEVLKAMKVSDDVIEATLASQRLELSRRIWLPTAVTVPRSIPRGHAP